MLLFSLIESVEPRKIKKYDKYHWRLIDFENRIAKKSRRRKTENEQEKRADKIYPFHCLIQTA